MKKFLIAIIGAFLITGCSDEDYANLNQDPINPSEVPAGFLVANATKSLFDQMGSTSVNRNVFRLFAQYWTETQYTNETNYDIRNRSIPDTHWSRLYRLTLFNLLNAKKTIENGEFIDEGQRMNQLAIAELVEIYTWQQLVDTFGNIPYSEALQGNENVAPAYDDAETIYNDLIVRVKAAYNNLNEGSEGFGSQDIVYSDDISMWKKFAASLQLKIAMRLADKSPSVAKALAEDAVNKGVFSNINESFSLQYENNNTNANPLYADLVLSGRRDFLPANTFVDYLNELEDPRRTVFFRDNKTDENGNVIYVGGIYGSLNTYTQFTYIGNYFYQADIPETLLNYTEVEFYLAEAVERGFAVGGTAEEHYNNAILSSFEFYELDMDEANAYIAKPDVAYSTAPGTWKQKIGKQFWIAMYNRGFEGWTVWRRLDAPTLNLPAASGNEVPVRFTYPAQEQTLNATNYNAASSAIGGDNLYTKLFWDVH